MDNSQIVMWVRGGRTRVRVVRRKNSRTVSACSAQFSTPSQSIDCSNTSYLLADYRFPRINRTNKKVW